MSLFDEAASFAVVAYSGYRRKGDDTPYVLHPFEVAAIAASMTGDEEVIAAALLHDVVEDASCTLDELYGRFGDRVAYLVASETEDKRRDLSPSESWHARKAESLEKLVAATDPGVRIIWLSDKLANIRSFSRLKEEKGDAYLERFNQKDPDEHEWYFRSVARATDNLSTTQAWREFTHRIDQVFGSEDEV